MRLVLAMVMVAGLVAHWGNCWHHARVADCCHENAATHETACCRETADCHAHAGSQSHSSHLHLAEHEESCEHEPCDHGHGPCDCRFECCGVQQYLPTQEPQNEMSTLARFDLAGTIVALLVTGDGSPSIDQGWILKTPHALAPELRLHLLQQRWLI